MSIFKCKMCGGTLEINNNETVATCEYCGTKQTLPRLDDDKKANLYDRANHFRRNNEFDKASGIYEQILNEDNTDAEAYWSLVLCRYGIEYVEDPSTHKRIPTVNRAQFTSIFDDDNYKSALEYGDSLQCEVYRAEAETINEIQKGILEISNKEEPFDVFICYKETDNNGRRTPDSVLANELYHQLVQEGFKVFFARITLEDKLGSAYEPYIFAALNSAKVMIVLGTKPEYFNAVWVKNEWSRYLSLVKNSNGKKMLIPAYKDMDPYDLPEEFSHLQAQDMSKLGFMQDIIRGIKKIISVDAPKTTVVKETVATGGNVNISPLLERAFIFLEDGNWQEADDYCEKVLDQEPKNAQAYLGKLMAELHVKKQENLVDCEQPFDTYSNYQKVVRFGDDSLVSVLNGYIDQINERNENKRLMNIYNHAVNAMKNANTESDYNAAARAFKAMKGFKDADALAEQCINKAEICRIYASAKQKMVGDKIENYEIAIKKFQSILGFKDVDKHITWCQKKIEEIKEKEAERLEAERKKETERLEAEQRRIEAEKAAKKRKKIIAITTLILCICIVFVIVINRVIIPNKKYNAAISLMNEGKVIDAYEGLIALNGYKDSDVKASEIFNQYLAEKLRTANVGDYVFFGKYEQDNDISNGKEDIEWIVLAKEDNKVLVISKYILDSKPYNSSNVDTDWEKCSLRSWLNNDFINNAFRTYEQNIIGTVDVPADINTLYNTNHGNITTDKIFVLSTSEAEKYLNKNSECETTEYAKIQGCLGWWWLRTTGSNLRHATFKEYDTIDYKGNAVYMTSVGVRPAMWIDISKD